MQQKRAQFIRSTSGPRPTVGHRTALLRDMYDLVTLAACDRMYWSGSLGCERPERAPSPHPGRAYMHWRPLVV
jgi:hypothetical protein